MSRKLSTLLELSTETSISYTGMNLFRQNEEIVGVLENLKANQRPIFFVDDFLASIVVFLVAIPLCMGIAIASGVPPTRGLITGIIGGIVAGSLSGSPLLVSGPAAGLSVLIWELVDKFGIQALGLFVLFTGMIQISASLLHLGQWFRAVSPAVIHGMLAGIGVLIFASQFHVMLDDVPRGSGIANLMYIPTSIFGSILDFSDGFMQHHFAAWIGAITISAMILWNRFKPKSLKSVPAPLIGVIIGSLVAEAFSFEIKRIIIPSNFLSSMNWINPRVFQTLWSWELLGDALVIAFIASAETLLSASAVDQMHSGPRTKYDRELMAQGIGNFLCGIFGALPMTGVIVRSTTNVQAGAKSRVSTILHGIWILLFVVFFPIVLRLIPTSSLAAILVYTGYKLVDYSIIRKLNEHGKAEVAIYLITLFTIVLTDLMSGVITGIVLALVKTLKVLSKLSIQKEFDAKNNKMKIVFNGALAFYQVPKLATLLDTIPPECNLELDVSHVTYIDHACLELLEGWQKRVGALQIRGRELPTSRFKNAA